MKITITIVWLVLTLAVNAASPFTNQFPNINVASNIQSASLTVITTNWSMPMPSSGLLGGTAGGAVEVLAPRFTNTVWVSQGANSYWVSAPWTNGARWEMQCYVTNTWSANGSYTMADLYIYTNLNPTVHSGGEHVGEIGDDVAPINTTFGVYVMGSHGWNITQVTWTNHSADIGDQLQSANGRLYAVTEITTTNKFFIAPNRADAILEDPTAGNLTNVTKATAAAAGTWSSAAVQHYPTWKVLTQWFQVDGVPVVSSNIIEGNVFEMGLSGIIFDPRPAYAAALGNPAFVYTNLPALLKRVQRHRINGNCQVTVDDTILSLSPTNWTMNYSGTVQATAPNNTNCWYWLPNSKLVGATDMSSPIAITNIPATTVYFTNAPASVVDTNLGLNVFWSFQTVSTTPATNFIAGHVMLYDPDYWDTRTAVRNASTTLPVWYFHSSKKSYPWSIPSVVYTNGAISRSRAYRKWFPSTGTFYNTVYVQRENDMLAVTNAYRTAMPTVK